MSKGNSSTWTGSDKWGTEAWLAMSSSAKAAWNNTRKVFNNGYGEYDETLTEEENQRLARERSMTYQDVVQDTAAASSMGLVDRSSAGSERQHQMPTRQLPNSNQQSQTEPDGLLADAAGYKLALKRQHSESFAQQTPMTLDGNRPAELEEIPESKPKKKVIKRAALPTEANVTEPAPKPKKKVVRPARNVNEDDGIITKPKKKVAKPIAEEEDEDETPATLEPKRATKPPPGQNSSAESKQRKKIARSAAEESTEGAEAKPKKVVKKTVVAPATTNGEMEGPLSTPKKKAKSTKGDAEVETELPIQKTVKKSAKPSVLAADSDEPAPRPKKISKATPAEDAEAPAEPTPMKRVGRARPKDATPTPSQDSGPILDRQTDTNPSDNEQLGNLPVKVAKSKTSRKSALIHDGEELRESTSKPKRVAKSIVQSEQGECQPPTRSEVTETELMSKPKRLIKSKRAIESQSRLEATPSSKLLPAHATQEDTASRETDCQEKEPAQKPERIFKPKALIAAADGETPKSTKKVTKKIVGPNLADSPVKPKKRVKEATDFVNLAFELVEDGEALAAESNLKPSKMAEQMANRDDGMESSLTPKKKAASKVKIVQPPMKDAEEPEDLVSIPREQPVKPLVPKKVSKLKDLDNADIVGLKAKKVSKKPLTADAQTSEDAASRSELPADESLHAAKCDKKHEESEPCYSTKKSVKKEVAISEPTVEQDQHEKRCDKQHQPDETCNADKKIAKKTLAVEQSGSHEIEHEKRCDNKHEEDEPCNANKKVREKRLQ